MPLMNAGALPNERVPSGTSKITGLVLEKPLRARSRRPRT